MLEQNRSLSLSEVLNQFRPVEAPKSTAGGGFQALLDSALASRPAAEPSWRAPGLGDTALPYEEIKHNASYQTADESSGSTTRAQSLPPQDTATSSTAAETGSNHSGNIDHSASKGLENPLGTARQTIPTEAPSKGIESVLRNNRTVREIPGKSKPEVNESHKIVRFDQAVSNFERKNQGQDVGDVRASLHALTQMTRSVQGKSGTTATAETPSESKAAMAALKKATSLVNSKNAKENPSLEANPQAMLPFHTMGLGGGQGQQNKPVKGPVEKSQGDSPLLPGVQSRPGEGPEGRAVSDAMKLVKELSGKLGMALGKDSLAAGEGIDRKIDLQNDKRFGRLELLRRERLGLGEEGRRVEIQNLSRVQSGTMSDGRAQAQVIAGLKSVRVEDASLAGSTGRDTSFYNPTMPQAIIHHTISLPGSMTPTEANFAQVLKTQLRESLNSEVVGQAKILLDGADKGEIKLVLHPESLGEVKIHLKLEENAIGGKIFVENKEVLEVFKDNMADLRDAFLQGGLDASALELAVGDYSGSGAGSFARDRREDRNFVQYAAEALTESVPVIRFQDGNNSLIDVVV